MAITDVIFDLDGTLVDSAPGILLSLRAALESVGLESEVALDRDLVGPPLMEIIDRLIPSESTQVRRAVADAFAVHYDNLGVLESKPFPGIDQCLNDLRNVGLKLWLATNKRRKPTRFLLDRTGWADMFMGAYSLDSLDPPKKSKGALLDYMIAAHNLQKRTAVYVGDRIDDYHAASACGLSFIMAGWGYAGAGEAFALSRTTSELAAALIQEWRT